MDVELLISKIMLKPAIWNKVLKSHTNRNIVDEAWKEIAQEMKVEETVLRNKWKYLRDQFAVEMGKLRNFSEDSGCVVQEPKWCYFRSLKFLKEVVRPRASKGNLSKTVSEDSLLSVSESEEASCVNVGASTSREEGDPTDIMETSVRQPGEGGSRKRKRPDSNSKYNVKILELEAKKLDVMQKVLAAKTDEDIAFFYSLLPHIKKIPDEQKFEFRANVQALVEHYVYDKNLNQEPIQDFRVNPHFL